MKHVVPSIREDLERPDLSALRLDSHPFGADSQFQAVMGWETHWPRAKSSTFLPICQLHI